MKEDLTARVKLEWAAGLLDRGVPFEELDRRWQLDDRLYEASSQLIYAVDELRNGLALALEAQEGGDRERDAAALDSAWSEFQAAVEEAEAAIRLHR